MRIPIFLILSNFFLMLYQECKPPERLIQVNCNFQVTQGNKPLNPDLDWFISENKDSVSVSTLKFYISGLEFLGPDKQYISSADINYLEPLSGNSMIICKGVPLSGLKRLRFTLGVKKELNYTNGLPATIDNLNMQWPELLGGGYHFLKLEGIYKHTGEIKGFAFHTGIPAVQQTVDLELNFPDPIQTESYHLQVNLDLEKVFNGWNFDQDKSNIMGDSVMMCKCMELIRNSFHVE